MHDIDSSEPLWVIHLKRALNLTHVERNHGQKMLLIAQEKTPYFACGPFTP
jgi:hypothetical protein